MTFDFSVTAGTQYAVAAVVAGLILGLIYDVFRLLRAATAYPAALGNVVTLVADLFFCALSSVVCLLVAFNYGNGELRGYALVLTFGVFMAYEVTVGKLTRSLSAAAGRNAVLMAGAAESAAQRRRTVRRAARGFDLI